jgi:outer membrane protein assembly factor BamB
VGGGTVLWTFDGHTPIDGPIAVAPDGSADFISADGMLHSIDSKGNEVFDRPASGLAPAVGPDGTIYVQGTTSWVYALDSKGRPRWKVNVGTGNGPLAADSNAVYANENGSLLAISGGETLWTLPLGTLSRGAIMADGVVVASSSGLSAVSTSGSTMWTFTPAGGFSGDLTVANGNVYCGSGSGTVYALDSRNGSVILQIASGARVTSGPVVNSSGSIFFGSDALYGIDSSGTALWSSNAIVPVAHGIAASSGGEVFDAASSGASSMIDAAGNIQWTARDLGDVTQAVAGPSGTVFVASSNGTVRSLR